MITENAIRTVRQFAKPGIESGLIPRDQFDEIIAAARTHATKGADSPKRKQVEMLTVKKVAEILNCSTKTVFRMRDSGALKGIYLTDSRKSLAELKHFIGEQKKLVEPPKRETVDLDGDWLDIIGAVSEAVGPRHEIFFHSGEIARLATETETMHFQPLKPVEACSELERFCRFEKAGKNGARVSTRLSEGSARPIVSAPEFARRMPAIERLADYPTPVWRDGEVLLTPPGYDPQLKTFTDPAGPEPEEMTLDRALELIMKKMENRRFGGLYTVADRTAKRPKWRIIKEK